MAESMNVERKAEQDRPEPETSVLGYRYCRTLGESRVVVRASGFTHSQAEWQWEVEKGGSQRVTTQVFGFNLLRSAE